MSMGTGVRKSRRPMKTSRVRRRITGLVAVLIATGGLVALPTVPAVAAAETMTFSKSASDDVLLGGDIAYTLKATNSGDTDEYNVSFRDVLPLGVTYKSGSTTPTSAGEPTVYTDSVTGQQTLVWRNASDAPKTSDVTLSFKATPSPTAHPVGDTVTNSATLYASSDPRYVPRFSTTGAYVDRSTLTTNPSSSATTAISALKLTKSEASPEGELLRGVHDHQTTYTLKVENNSSTPTNTVTVTDYLPAGLELLGCGGVDNSAAGFEEYTGSGRINGPAVGSDCLAPTSVTTVNSGLPSGYPAGVYTKVTWTVGNLAGGGAQTIKYAAAIPMRENVMPASPGTFVSTANLDNNSGAFTRETATEKKLTNRAVASGTYTGTILNDPTDKTVSSSASTTVEVEDVAVQKSVSPGAFAQGGIATYTLKVRGSEYTTASNIVVKDQLPNGLCPLDNTDNYDDKDDPQCAKGAGLVPTGASYASVADQNTSGFAITFTPLTLAKNEVKTVTYKARMRANYVDGTSTTSEPTASGDSFTNKVTLAGQTAKVPANETGTDPVAITDASQAGLSTDAPTLDKQIGTYASPMTCSSADYTNTGTAGETTFKKGDRVCFKIRVDFSSANSTRDPVVTDFLPDGVTYDAGSAAAVTGAGHNTVTFTEAGTDNPVFTIGTTSGTHKYVAPGSVFEIVLSGTVGTAGAGAVDVAGNLAKFRWTDKSGKALSLRDRVDFNIAPAPSVGITKDAAILTGGTPGAYADQQSTRQGAKVRFRVNVANISDTDGIEGNSRSVSDVQVWDNLPAPFTCADIDSGTITNGGTCSTVGGVARIVWAVPGPIAVAASRNLTYDVTVPTGVTVDNAYINTAGVRSFKAATNVSASSTTTHYPASNIDPDVTAAQADALAASDTASVILPKVELTKTNVTGVTETGNAAAGEAVSGESVTYTIRAKVPARSTIYNGVLADVLPTGITFGSASWKFFPDATSTTAGTPTGTFTQAAATGNLTFPTTYTNTSSTDQVFEVTIVGKVKVNDNCPTNGTASPSACTSTQTNTATFDSKIVANGLIGVPQESASSNVVVKTPTPTLVKTSSPASGSNIVAGQTVTYTLTYGNTGPVPLHDAVIYDCLPDALATGTLPSGATTATGVTPQCTTAGFTTITIPVGDVAAGVSGLTKTYTATLATAAAGGNTYTNSAKLLGSTLANGGNDTTSETTLTATSSANVKTAGATVAKTVVDNTLTIGEYADYTVTADVPANLNFYDLAITDTLPIGLDASTITGVTWTCQKPAGTAATCPAGATATPNLTSSPNPTVVTSASTIGWFLDTLPASTDTRRFILKFKVKVADTPTNVLTTSRTNTANVRWNSTDKTNPTTVTSSNWTSSASGTRAITIEEPKPTIAKSVSNASPAPGDTFTYTVTPSNPTTTAVPSNSTAFNVVVKDVVPTGVEVVTSSISGGGSYDAGTRTITWPAIASIAPGASATPYTYQAKLVDSATLTTGAKTNTASITAYDSLATGGRSYAPTTIKATATVTPVLPKVTITKAASDAVAYVGQDSTFTLTAKNDGTAPATSITVKDLLPKNWELGSGTPTVKIGSAPAFTMSPTDDAANPRTLTWTAIGPVPVGTSVVITYTARPTADALTDAGAGATVPHTNTASVVAKDATGATGSASGDYNGGPATASVHIDKADLQVTKTGSGDIVAGQSYSWAVAIKNNGTDTAVGSPFTVTDTLPSQLTGVTASGTGWACGAATTTVTCTRTGSLASGASFPSITVTGQVPSDLASGTDITNKAVVSGKTYDPTPGNNTSTVTTQSTAKADLKIVKALTSSVVAGQNATYTLDVSNLGPSTSRHDITVTDVLPSGLTFVSAAGTGWTCAAPGGTVTCTRTADLPSGEAADQIVLTVKVAASRAAGSLSNTATVAGTTPDPATTNNTSTATGTVTTAATLSIAKTLQGTTPLVAGANGTYEVVVGNNGPSDATGVVVTDVLPSYLSFVSSSTGCTASGQTVTCAVGTLAPAASSTALITVKVASGHTGQITNVASATSTTNPAVVTDDDTNTPTVTSDISITKSHTGNAVAGSDFTYTLAVKNNGPSDSTGPLTVTDTLPAGMSFKTATGGGWSCTAGSGQTVTCTRTGTLTSGSTTTFTMTVAVAPDAGPASQVVNTASVDGPNDPDVTNDSVTDKVDIVDQANVKITKTAGSATGVAGGDVSWTMAVTNDGPSTADSVVVTDSLPAGLTLKSVAGSGWTCTPGTGSFSCSRSTLAPGAAPAITLVSTIGSAVAKNATITNAASVSTATPGDVSGDNTDDDSVTVTTDADLQVTKEHTGTPVAGKTFGFQLAVKNNGLSRATGPVRVTDTLPVGLTYVGVSGTDWTCVAAGAGSSGQQVVCTLTSATNLAAGASAPGFTMTVQVAPDTEGDTLTNTAKVKADETSDSKPTNDTATDSVTPTGEVDLSITKSHTASAVAVGQDLDFTLKVHNAGPSEAKGVKVTDTLPAGLTFVSASGSDWTCTAAVCTYGSDLGVDADTTTLTVTATVGASAYPSVTNAATVESTTPETKTSDNSTTDPVTVPPLADLTVSKKLVGSLAVGSNATYEITVENDGPTDSPDPITVRDVLPAGLTHVSATGTGWACFNTAGTVSCTDADGLTNGESSTITLTVAVGQAAYPSVKNTATITPASPFDEDPTDDSGSTTDDVAGLADLSITKTHDAGDVKVGDDLDFAVTVHNDGPSEAFGVKVADTLPAGLTFVSASGTDWTCTSTTCTYDETLASGDDTSELTVTATVTAASYPSATNKAIVSATTTDPVSTNNTALDQVIVPPLVDLSVVKTLTSSLKVGENATYTLAVKNDGPTDDPGPVTVSDELPAGLTFVSASGGDFTCAEAGGTVTCTDIDGLTDGETSSITLTVAVGGAAFPTVANTATIASPAEDTDATNDESTDTHGSVGKADLSITKGHVAGDVHVGDDLSFLVQVHNDGPSLAQDVKVTDTLPAGLTFVSASGTDWTCVDEVCTYDADLASGADAPAITVVATVEAGAYPKVTNSVEVESSTPDPDPTDNTDDDLVEVPPLVDLHVQKKLVGSLEVGQEATYEITVKNEGATDDPGPVTVADVLPAGLTFVSATGSDWACFNAAGTVTCTDADGLEKDESTTITLTVTVGAAAYPSVTNTADVSSDAEDTDASDDSSSTTDDVDGQADLSITKSHDAADVKVGENTSFTLVVHNDGPTEAKEVKVADTLPADLTFVSAAGDDWSCTDAVCTYDLDLASGDDSSELTVVATVEASAYPSITNAASVGSDTTDPDGTNNDTTDLVTVPPLVDLEIDKKLVGGLEVGENATYTLDVTNHGPTADPGPVTVTDELPDGLTFVSATGAGWTCLAPAGVVTCTDVDGLDVDESTTISLVVAVGGAAFPSVSNTATVDSDAEDTDPDNNSSTVPSTSTGRADLSITKSHDAADVKVGEDTTFTLSVHNDGPSLAQDVEVTDTLPAGLTLVSASGTGWTCDADSAVCTYDTDLASGADSSPLTVVATVTAAAYPSVDNTATVTSDTPDPNDDDNETTDPVTVPALVDLSVDKKLVGSLVVGKKAVYELTVKNDGPTDDPGPVTVTDELPAGLTFVSGSGPGWTCADADGTVTCTDADGLEVDETSTIRLIVQVGAKAYPKVTNAAVVASDAEDTDPDDDTSDVTSPVGGTSVLTIEKSLTDQDDDLATWSLEVTNLGPTETTKDIVVVDPLPKGLTFVSAKGAGWTCDADGQDVTCTRSASLAVDASSTIALKTRITADDGQEIVNSAEVLSGGLTLDDDDAVVDAPDPDAVDGLGGILPDTGGPVLWILLAGLLAAGAGGLVLTRRRPKHTPRH